MADETVVAAGDPTDVVPENNGEVPENAGPKDGEPDPQPTQNQPDDEPDKPHKKGGWQRKIERLEKQNEALIQALMQRQPVEQPKPADKPVDDDPEPDPEQFESTLEYLKAARAWDRRQAKKEALTEFETKLEQREKAKVEKEQAKTREAKFQEKIDAYGKDNPDFIEAISDPEFPLSKNMLDEVMDLEQPAEVIAYLSQHPEEAKRIYSLDAKQTTREIARIEARIATQEPEATEDVDKPAPPPIKVPPKPPTPIKKNAPVDNGELRDDLPPDEWARRFDKKMADFKKRGGI